MIILIKRMVLDRSITMMLTEENDKCDFAQEEMMKTMIKTKTKTRTKTESKSKKTKAVSLKKHLSPLGASVTPGRNDGAPRVELIVKWS